MNPGSEDLEMQLLKMRKKIDAGAEFFQTQAIFDIDADAEFFQAQAIFDAEVMEKAAKFGAPFMAASCR